MSYHAICAEIKQLIRKMRGARSYHKPFGHNCSNK